MQTDIHTYIIMSHLIFLRMRNVSDKICRENQNTHFVFSNFFPRKSCVCEMLKNVVQLDGPQSRTIKYGACALNAG